MDHIAEVVAKKLNLDVASALDEFFQVKGGVAECGLGFRRRRLQSRSEIGLCTDNAHAAPAAAGTRLDENGEAVLASEISRIGKMPDAPGAWNPWDTHLLGKLDRGQLVAHGLDRFGRWAYER